MKSIRKTNLWTHAQANTSTEGYFGLSYNQLSELAADPLSGRSVLQWQTNISNETLDRVPLFRVAEALLLILQEQAHIKMTPLGKLPRKVVLAVHQQGFVEDPADEKDPAKIWREEDCLYLFAARNALQLSPLVTVKLGKMRLTRTALKLLQAGNRLELFKHFFTAFTQKYNWASNDRYTSQPVGQFGWAYSLYLLLRMNDSVQPMDFYGVAYVMAFPLMGTFIMGSPRYPAEQQLLACYATRVVRRFMVWFGLCIESTERSYFHSENDQMIASALLPELFYIFK